MNNLSDRQLKQLIREALSRIEAECIAQFSPMAGLGMDLGQVRDILVARAETTGQTWDDYLEVHDAVDAAYDMGDKHSERLRSCKNEMEQRASNLAMPPPAPRRRRRPLGNMAGFASAGSADKTMPIGERALTYMIREELTKTEETDIKKLISKELSSSQSEVAKSVKKIVEDELSKVLKTKAVKDDITDITKKVMKRLYKDLSFHHPYIIDRIKV
jgi:gas vesicle protein